MASKVVVATTALLLTLNLLFFTLVSSTACPSVPKSTPRKSSPKTTVPVAAPPSCPKDTLKLRVCGDLLGGLVSIVVGTQPTTSPCCSLLQGLADIEAAACLCTAIKANVLGINLNDPVSLSLLLNTCGKTPPWGFKCA